jgi:transposase
MYVRTKSSPRSKNISVQIVESHRVDGKIKQNVIRHLGTTQPGDELEKLKQLAQGLILELKQQVHKKVPGKIHETRFGAMLPISEDLFLHGASIEEAKRVILGIHDIYGYIYDQIGFINPFSNASRRESSARILREIVLARIANPQSKRASVEQLTGQFGVELNLDHVYQMMDKIDDIFCERIQKYALAATLNLTGEKLRVLFYDATTLYFESFSEDDLKQNGYSKDMKFNQPQVMLALFVTQSGLPVGYELFPGRTFEGHSLQISLGKLKERYNIDQVVLVADRGMLSDTNLCFLEENSYQYIVGAKLRSLDEAGQTLVLGWLDSLQKDIINEEVTHRVTITPSTKSAVKVFFSSLAEVNFEKINDQTYLLWRENNEWKLSIYRTEAIKDIPISSINGLGIILAQLAVTEKKVSRQCKQIITKLIGVYHNQPKTLVLSYRPDRALKDRAEREKAIQKLHARLRRSKNPKQLISKYGFQKYVKVEGDAQLQIDDNKFMEEARWDGVAGIYISDHTLSNSEAIEHYRGLWQVEESFRIQKHDLKIRPVYHWTPRRIQAHIAIAFMAFVCVRYLEYRLLTQSQKLSPRAIKEALLQYQASIIKDTKTDKFYLLPSKITPHVKEIYRVIGLRPKQGLQEIKCSA